MKQAAAVALIVIVLFTGLPAVAAMGHMPPCPECRLGPSVGGLVCAALLSIVGLVVIWAATWLSLVQPRRRLLLIVTDLDPPPRLD
jgi:hypothetical protein